MGEVIQARELEVGDLYRTYSALPRDTGGSCTVRRVVSRRVLRTVESYEVLETASIDGRGLRGEISLRSDVAVERLERQCQRDVVAMLPYLEPGTTINVTYFDQSFWV